MRGCPARLCSLLQHKDFHLWKPLINTCQYYDRNSILGKFLRIRAMYSRSKLNLHVLRFPTSPANWIREYRCGISENYSPEGGVHIWPNFLGRWQFRGVQNLSGFEVTGSPRCFLVFQHFPGPVLFFCQSRLKIS
jgi:hypothetical protein